MGLSRFIIFLALCAAGYWLWKKIQLNTANRNQPQVQQENMVQCQHCNLFLPQQQAVRKANQWFCCDDHARRN